MKTLPGFYSQMKNKSCQKVTGEVNRQQTKHVCFSKHKTKYGFRALSTRDLVSKMTLQYVMNMSYKQNSSFLSF